MSDQAIERLLRGLQGPPEGGHYGRQSDGKPANGDCPDAETLAAFADDTLASVVRREVEAHVADCHRCQMLTAAMARAERAMAAASGETASEGRTWKRRAFNWLVPAAAAATAVALWVIVPGQRTRLAEAPELDRQTVVTETAPGAPSEAPANEPLRDEPQTRQREFAPESTDARADSAQRVPATPAELGRTAPATPPRDTVTEPALEAEESLGIRAQASAPQPPARTGAQQSAAQTTESPVAGSLQASGSEARNEAVRSETADQQERAPRSAPTAPATRVAPLRALPAFEIASPNPQVRWRVVTGSTVQRSVDGGVTWTTQQTGTTTELTAGSAPSPDVCWLVGRGGIVLRTADGGDQWQRATIPATADLTTVTAPTALNAIVTTTDRRRFQTTDGGRTWALLP